MRYTHILFDADETLFSYHSYVSLKRILHGYGVEFTEQDYQKYNEFNQSLWQQYQDNVINLAELTRIRFQDFEKNHQINPLELHQALMNAMGLASPAKDGALILLKKLREQGVEKIGILTNGFTVMQMPRLQHTGLSQYIDFLVVSEEVGLPKPNLAMFENAFEKMNFPPREQILMVGDSLTSDILGGNRAGIDTCWVNWHGKINQTQAKPTFQVADLFELSDFLGL